MAHYAGLLIVIDPLASTAVKESGIVSFIGPAVFTPIKGTIKDSANQDAQRMVSAYRPDAYQGLVAARLPNRQLSEVGWYTAWVNQAADGAFGTAVVICHGDTGENDEIYAGVDVTS
jgi:hypothetical protein